MLGFDTATIATAVGLRTADGGALQARDDPGDRERPGHATRLLAMAGELLGQAGVGWDQIERIAVGLGPGRFTGLRVGVATARGLAQSLSVSLVGVSSLRALAHAARREGQTQGLIAVIDALRGEAFAAAYPVSDEQPSMHELAFERPLRPADLEGLVATLEQRGCAPGQQWLAIGDGAVRFRSQLALAGATVADDDSPLHRIDAAAICELGARAQAPSALADVLPDYRRTPDAALARERAVTLGGAKP